MFKIYVYVFDTLADWELGYITAELNSCRFFKKEAPRVSDTYPQYWTPSSGGIFMRYSKDGFGQKKVAEQKCYVTRIRKLLTDEFLVFSCIRAVGVVC